MQSIADTQKKGAAPFGKFERKLAARYLGARKSEGGVGLIAVLSFTCIALAIWAMITIMSIMNGFRETTVGLTLGTDGHMFVASAAANPLPEQIEALRSKLANIEGVQVAFPYTETQTFVQAQGRFSGANVTGIKLEHLKSMTVISEAVIAGSFEGYGVGNYGGDRVVIGSGMAATLGLTAGDRLTLFSPTRVTTVMGSSNIRRKNYTIAGVFNTGLLKADGYNIYMPLEQASLFFNQGRAPSEIQMRLDNPDMIHKLKPVIRDVAGEPVYVYTWEDKNSGFATALKTEQVAMRFIFMIVVVIAVFPVLAAMIMLVKNKGKDIAILRTIGATSGSVLRIFLMSGAAIGMLGTIAGIILGILFCLNIEYVQAAIEFVTGAELFPADVYGIDHLPVKIVASEVLLVSIWGFLISAAATFFPALTASKIDPVEALRYE
ncbi:MAG: lipoprotein-releasing system transmembrane subunit LolC [Robiginitomaculum sp.]|nr:MAG: lipoprotein-releasing system transmembrane subunit LolC [Robiginitomaculum sp.]